MKYKGDYSWSHDDLREMVIDAVLLEKDGEERDKLLYYQATCHEISGLFAYLLQICATFGPKVISCTK